MSTMNSIQYNQNNGQQHQQSFDKRSRKNSDGVPMNLTNDQTQLIESKSILSKNKQNPQHRKTLTFSSVSNAQYSGAPPNHGQLTGQQQNVVFSSVIMNSNNQISPLKLSSNPDTPKTLGEGGAISHQNPNSNQQQLSMPPGNFKFNNNNAQLAMVGNSTVNQRNNNLQVSQGATHRSNPNVSNVTNHRIQNNQLNKERLQPNVGNVNISLQGVGGVGGGQGNVRNSKILHKSQMSKHIDENRIKNNNM